MAGVWEQVLGQEQIGLEDNFFEIGGHSLLATQIIARLNRLLRLALPLKTLFENPTVAELVRYLGQAHFDEPGYLLPALQTLPRPAHLPLSFAQQRIWFLNQMEPDNASYNLSASLSLTGLLQSAALEQSLNEIIARHEAMRTLFSVVDGQPVQVVRSGLYVPLIVVALEQLSAEQQTREAQRLAREEFLLPFDLNTGPLMRFHLLRLEAEKHLLLLNFHHIICDGWSMQVFLRELSLLYQAYTQGQPSPLSPLPLQYADYTLWQQQWLQGEVLGHLLAYWQQQLADAPTMLELPTDYPRPAVQTFRGALQRVALSQEILAELKTLSRQEGVTLFMTLLTAFAILLARYCGQDDLLIGTPIANRQHDQLEDLIGSFANTLVLRIDLSGRPAFRELLSRVRQVALEAYAHQDLPFEKLVEALEPQRSLSYSPLFQVMFALENASSSPLALPGLAAEFLEVENRGSKYDLGLSLQETAGGLTGVIEYNIDLFAASTIERMSGHWQQLLASIVAHPERPIHALPWLTGQEQRQILEVWNGARAAYPQEHSLSQILEQQALRTPDAIALVFAEEQLTYQELNERANQLARYLRRKGVGPEVLVGIALERSLNLVIGMLGILKAGGAYVPFDPSYPMERLTFMLSDTRTPVLLTQTDLLEHLPPLGGQQICLDRDWPLFASEARSNLPCELGPDSLAYMIYTSGSTGRPKGVLIPQRGVCNLAEVQAHLFGLQPGDRILQFASLSFDASLWEIIMALYVGATLCLATRETLLPGTALVRLLQEQAITAVTLPPSALAVLPATAFPALKIILTTGEASTAELVKTWAPGYRFFNGYGPTETTICATAFECPESDSNPPIGRPIANTQIYVLDTTMQLVPVGIPGEMYIGGVTVARGYHQRPELTAERFVPDPFSSRPGQRLYRTGDLARYLPDGLLEFIGRADTQVKLRGVRIELGEIETALRQYPGVQEVAVLMREDLPGDKRLIAYLAGNEQSSPLSTSDLRHYLQECLPEYMVPSALILLASLPHSANGKVDRRSLPAPEGLRPEMETTYLAPRTPLEGIIAATWQELLHLEKVGIHDNFFDLGGHSLLMVQAQSKLRETLKHDLTIVDLFKYPTISTLATFLSQREGDPSPPQPDDERITRLREGKHRVKAMRARTTREVRKGRED